MSGDRRREEHTGTWTNEHTGTHWDNRMNAADHVDHGTVSTRPGGIPPQSLDLRRMGGGSVGFVADGHGMAGQVHGFDGRYHQKYDDQARTHRALSPRSQSFMQSKQRALEATEASLRSEHDAVTSADRTGFAPFERRRPHLHAHLMAPPKPETESPLLSPIALSPPARRSASLAQPLIGGPGHAGAGRDHAPEHAPEHEHDEDHVP